MSNLIKNLIKRAFTISEAAEYACVSEGTIRNWVNSQIISFEELPGRGNGSHKFRLIRKSDLDKFLDKNYQQASKKPIKKFSKDFSLLPVDS